MEYNLDGLRYLNSNSLKIYALLAISSYPPLLPPIIR